MSMIEQLTETLIDETAESSELFLQWDPDSYDYAVGDRVGDEGVHYPTLEDPIYESTIDNNIWSPAAYSQGLKLVE